MPSEAHQTEAHRLFCADQTTFLLQQVRSIWLVKRGIHTALCVFGSAASLVVSAWFPDASEVLVAAATWLTASLVLVLLRSLEDVLCGFDDEVLNIFDACIECQHAFVCNPDALASQPFCRQT